MSKHGIPDKRIKIQTDLLRDLINNDNRGIKHDFPFINIRKVPREVLKTEGEARGFHTSRNQTKPENKPS